MLVSEVIGFLAGAFITFSIVPQVVRVFQLRSAREISALFTALLFLGAVLWLAYGVYLMLTPVIVWNSVGVILIAILLYQKYRYGR